MRFLALKKTHKRSFFIHSRYWLATALFFMLTLHVEGTFAFISKSSGIYTAQEHGWHKGSALQAEVITAGDNFLSISNEHDISATLENNLDDDDKTLSCRIHQLEKSAFSSSGFLDELGYSINLYAPPIYVMLHSWKYLLN